MVSGSQINVVSNRRHIDRRCRVIVDSSQMEGRYLLRKHMDQAALKIVENEASDTGIRLILNGSQRCHGY